MQDIALQYLAEMIYSRSGIVLGAEKHYLIENRLQPFLRGWGCENLAGLVAKLKAGGQSQIEHEIIEALTTNESSFFRDNKPFQYFAKTLLPALKETQKDFKQLRLWSAACSNGQEPYSLVMLMNEDNLESSGFSYQFLATDLADKVIKKATDGVYSQFEVQRGMPVQLLLKYFEQTPDQQWRVKQTWRDKVNFKTFNLLDSPAAFGKFDVIFCRNVLIYFDDETRKKVVERLVAQLQPKGFIVVGSTESIDKYSDKIMPVADGELGFYQRKAES